TEAEQLKLVIERSKTQTHISHASGSSVDEGTCSLPGVPDVPTYDSDDEKVSWKSSKEDNDDEVNVSEDDDTDNDDDDNDDDVDKDINDDNADNQDKDDQDAKNPDDDNEQTDSDNNGDDLVHPKLSTHDEEEREEERFNPRVQTPSHVESTDDEDSDEEGRDTVMTDALLPNVLGTQITEDTHVIITDPVIPEGEQQSSSMSSGFISNMLNPRPDTGIDSIFTFNTKATSLVYVLVTTIAEPPLVSVTTLPPPPTPFITHMQQTPVSTPTTVPSSSLQDLPNFGSLFRFDHRLKSLVTDFSEFKQTN
ncbi:hypothetical protein Tco_0037459, partial [Tanacetum coccineum]